MLNSLLATFKILQRDEKKELFIVTFLMTFMAFFEFIGVSSIFPFMGLLSDNNLAFENRYFSTVYTTLGFESVRSFIIFMGLSVIFMIVSSSMCNILTNYKIIKFSELCSSSISTRLLKAYMKRPYPFFLQTNPTELSKNVLGEVNNVSNGVILSFLNCFSRGVLLLTLFILIFWVNYKVAFGVFVIFGLSYLVIYYKVRRRLAQAGKERVVATRNKHVTLAKAFGGIKEIKISNSAEVFIAEYEMHFRSYAKHQVFQQIYGIIPKFILESIAFGSIILFMLYMFISTGDFKSTIPTLSLFALAGYKCLPALQIIYTSISKIKFFIPSVNILDKELNHTSGVPIGTETIKFDHKLELRNIKFNYEGIAKPILDDVSLEIMGKSTVGIVGSTGAGKTTLVDILMGLLTQTKGDVIADGQRVSFENMLNWQSKIGYVPQRIYLSDDSVAKNIAFGVDEKEIDFEKIKIVAQMARIHDFIQSDLPEGYKTNIGDRGVRLSGGQCQRIGIARALYRNPSLLILDEATSALDNLTESEIVDMIRSLNGNCTIIIIAHRLTTVQSCDKIFYMENGKVAGEGTFVQLLENVPGFKALANLKS
jgi:ABC-type bacteriocin/lantibiotic exporter with double-glycine peptidase domain